MVYFLCIQVEEKVVMKIMKQVNVTRREQELKLEQSDFDERRNINKRKRLILEGRSGIKVNNMYCCCKFISCKV